MIKYLIVILIPFVLLKNESFSQVTDNFGLRKTPVSYHLSFDNDDFFNEDIIEQSGKKSLVERNIFFPKGKFGNGIQMRQIPTPPDADNMSGIDLDLVTAVIFNTRPGNKMGYNQPFIWGSGRINTKLGAVAFWARGELSNAGPLFEQTSVSFGRKERDLLGVLVDENKKLSAYIRDSRYIRHEIQSEEIWDEANWNHIVLNWDWMNGMELWINGKNIASSWGNQSWFETAPPGLFHLPAAGLIYDELYLMDRPVTEKEIKNLIAYNKVPNEESIVYKRPKGNVKEIRSISGAEFHQNLPIIDPNNAIRLKEVWPKDASDGTIPGWYVIDGRNEMAWPHPYALFTIIPGDADFKAEKVDLSTSLSSQVNFVTLTGNLTNVSVQASTSSDKEKRALFKVPQGDHFFYGSKITTTTNPTFRIPFTEEYGTPEGFEGDIHVPLSGEKRIHNIGLFKVDLIPFDKENPPKGRKLALTNEKRSLDQRIQFAIHALTSRDERKVSIASNDLNREKAEKVNIGMFSRLNIISEPYFEEKGIKSITLSIPIRTKDESEVLFVRMRDPAVPSRMWNQFAIKLEGFNKGFKKLNMTLDFQDIVVTGGDRLWIDLGTSGNTELLIADRNNTAELYVEEVNSYEALDAYVEKQIVSSKAQYAKMYEFMPWQFTGKAVSLERPYSFGGPFDIIMPALAIERVKPDDFVSKFMIRMAGPDFKDGRPIEPNKTPLITLDNPYKAPEWALYMRDFNHKRHAIADWWADKQNPDGQVGGGWNDDVLFLSYHMPDLPLDGNENARYIIDAANTGLEKTNYFKGGYCNIHPIDRMHTGDFISERYNTIVNNLGQAYAFEREMESAWRHGKEEETPVNYFERGFRSSVNILKWYWGENAPLEPYRSKSLDSLSQEFRLYTSVLDDYSFYRFTESHVHTDDFAPVGSNLMYTYLLGGERGNRLDADMKFAVSWPYGGGPDVSRIVLNADDNSLEVVAYSFDHKMRELGMRLSRINNGLYKINLYKDLNGKGEKGEKIWESEKELKRFDVIKLPIPSQTPVLIELEQINRLEKQQQLSDLAIDPWGAIFEKGAVTAKIHNLGNESAENATIGLFDGDVLIQEKTIDIIPAPIDFLPKVKEVIFEDVSFTGNLNIRIDSRNQLKEILKENNAAHVYRKGAIAVGIAPKK